jgi:hypothetical protein
MDLTAGNKHMYRLLYINWPGGLNNIASFNNSRLIHITGQHVPTDKMANINSHSGNDYIKIAPNVSSFPFCFKFITFLQYSSNTYIYFAGPCV